MTRRVLIILLCLVVILVALFFILRSSCSRSVPQTSPSPAPSQQTKIKSWRTPPPMTIDTNKKYTATIETEKGNMIIELFPKDAPMTVNSFVFLAREGFYEGATFHRVLKDFMAQGGDPTGTGTGGPGYQFKDEFSSRTHTAGAISMANAGANTNGSQFFICFTPQPGLDGKHTVFGQLVQGMEVLKSLKLRDPAENPQYPGDKIIRVTIQES